MNALLTLDPDELDAVIDLHAGRIGQGDEAASDRACARIRQLERIKTASPMDREYEPAGALAQERTGFVS